MTDRLRRKIWMFWIVLLFCSFGKVAMGDTIRLHDQIGVTGNTVTLGEVAELSGRDAIMFADVVVGAFGETQSKLDVQMDDLRLLLREKGINLARIDIKGYDRCVVHRMKPTREEESQNEPVFANTDVQVDVKVDTTLRGLLIRKLASEIKTELDDVRVVFQKRDLNFLATSTMGKKYDIDFSSRNRIGRVSMIVREITGNKITSKQHVAAMVSKRVVGLAIKSMIRGGETVRSDQVERKEVWSMRRIDEPIASMMLIEGQVAGRTLVKDTLIYPDDLRKPRLIKRGEIISVYSIVSNVVVQLTARANEDGAMDDVITLRNIRTNQEIYATVVGRGEATVYQAKTDVGVEQAKQAQVEAVDREARS
ncbi:flagellar basal body P-ring formation chaperone FlgA [Poriferisphaera sp. WC338]|uniref:flagellar basal body P-ring formation chaperone FlgA n=1 Tax=Poriferisphaera sp. WC338 TaxID=3425129 RepID=UPI003D81B48E